MLFHHQPTNSPIPLLVTVPHAGREFPDATATSFCTQDPLVLHRDADLYVHELYDWVPALGGHLLGTTINRYVIDLNRHPDQRSPHFCKDAPAATAHAGLASNLGLVAHATTLNEPLLHHLLLEDEIQRRVMQYHQPFYQQAQALQTSLLQQFGFVFHIDAHSMPSVAKKNHQDFGKTRPQICLGDVHGQACDPKLTQKMADLFAQKNYSVGINEPYKGGYISQHFGSPARRQHTLQIELGRSLYMDEMMQTKIDGFSKLKDDLQAILTDFCGWMKSVGI